MKRTLAATLLLGTATIGCSTQGNTEIRDVSERDVKGQYGAYQVIVREMPARQPDWHLQEVTLLHLGTEVRPSSITGWRTFDPKNGVRFHDVNVYNLDDRGRRCFAGSYESIFAPSCTKEEGEKYTSMLISGYVSVQK